MTRILVADDQISVRKGLKMRLALEPDLQVVGEAADGNAALDLTRELEPDVVVIDVEMPRMDGIAAVKEIRATMPEVGVVMLSIHDDAETVARGRRAGAQAFVSKESDFEVLLAAIRRIVRRGPSLPEQSV